MAFFQMPKAQVVDHFTSMPLSLLLTRLFYRILFAQLEMTILVYLTLRAYVLVRDLSIP